jgi:DNA-binding response OmpR family regulator
VRTPPLILVVEDNPSGLDILQTRLTAHNYDVITATDGEEGLAMARQRLPDLILLDIMMPKMDGIEVCRQLKEDSSLPFIPIIMATAKAGSQDLVAGLEAGGDEYLTKPLDHTALIARVKSMLRIKDLHDTVREQAARLKEQSTQLAEWNRTLEQRVAEQLIELEHVGRLKRFLSPQLAQLVVSSEDEGLLESHRRDITVVFCDLRGFTAFSETGEPEEVMGVLREYHEAMGELIFRFEGTLERFAGDGLMVFFNDPLPCKDPAARAIKMAAAMVKRVGELSKKWRKRGHQLGFGVGIAQGYATLGKIGFDSQRVYGAVEEMVDVEPLGEFALKGLHRPVNVYNVLSLKGGLTAG